ncbi:Isopenicillin N epimerase [compost metagenome]
MLAPIGTGFFYCRKSVLGLLDPPSVGYHSVDSTEDHMHYMLEYRPTAARFEEALANFTGIWGLDAAVRIQLALTPARIESHILTLTDYACEALLRKGYQIVSSRNPGEASGNLSFKHSGHDAQELSQRLRDAGVDLAVRGGNLRISPTYYNDSDEIDRLIEALPS